MSLAENLMFTGRPNLMALGGRLGALTKLSFEHDFSDGSGMTLREEDYGDGKSYILQCPEGSDMSNIPAVGAEGAERDRIWRYVIEPRALPEQRVAMVKREEMAERERRRRERETAERERRRREREGDNEDSDEPMILVEESD